MKRKAAALPYVLLGLFLVIWVNLPKSVSEKLRANTVAALTPAWNQVEKFKKEDQKLSSDLANLQVQNHYLRSRLETACEWLAWERAQRGDGQTYIKHWLDLKCAAIPATVIYRDPSSWSSSLWIRAGEEENQILGKAVVAKNSPVVSGMNLIGVIDYVGKHQSRVRLITDSSVVPAVRAVRGGIQNREIASIAQVLCQRLEHREDLKLEFQNLIGKLNEEQEDLYLAKGELHGSSSPLWRSRSLFLKGEGFNYEFADSHGHPRDLRSSVSLIKEGDLLITSGLDGVFPEGLAVGYVTEVEPLKEGSYAYNLIARPTIGHINEIKTVFILPPLSAE